MRGAFTSRTLQNIVVVSDSIMLSRLSCICKMTVVVMYCSSAVFGYSAAHCSEYLASDWQTFIGVALGRVGMRLGRLATYRSDMGSSLVATDGNMEGHIFVMVEQCCTAADLAFPVLNFPGLCGL
jgi:hypothetical protein